MKTFPSDPEPFKTLEKFVDKRKSPSEAAKELDISRQFLFDILKRHKGVPESVAAKLGYVRKYIKVRM